MEIAARVRQVRFFMRLSQTQFAKALGITRNRIANVENGRTPLSVDLADNLALKFDVGLSWLATGRGRIRPSMGLISQIKPGIKGSEWFSSAFSDDIRQRLIERYQFHFLASGAILFDDLYLPKGEATQKFLDEFHAFLDDHLQQIPHKEKEKLLNLLIRIIAKFDSDQ